MFLTRLITGECQLWAVGLVHTSCSCLNPNPNPEPRTPTPNPKPRTPTQVDETLLPPKAQAARETGRTRFRESRWAEAAEAFSDAIEASGVGSHTLYTNRALCYQKLQRWPDVERDARAAMSCSGGGGSSVKAHYLLGKALLEQDKLEAAKEALLKSMSLSSSPDFKSYRGSIDAALFLAQKKIWQRQQVPESNKTQARNRNL
jgi:tetratricopeptide (TPR) repeat protein